MHRVKPEPKWDRLFLVPVLQTAFGHLQHLGGIALAEVVVLRPCGEDIGEGGVVHEVSQD